MAGTSQTRVLVGVPGIDPLGLRVQVNALIDDVEVLRAALALANTKVNAIITAAGTNIGAVAALPALTTTTVDAAGDLTAAKIL